MKVCHVTTFWPNRFGHTHYTDNLVRGMRQHQPAQHILAAEHPCNPRNDEAILSIPCFRREEDYVDGIVDTVKGAGADVALLQYSNDIFGEDTRFPRLIERLNDEGIRTVVNLHSVYPANWHVPYTPGRRVGDFDRAVASHATCLNVHSHLMRQDLISHGVDEAKVTVIPHGSNILTPLDRDESMRSLGIPVDRRMVLFFGFVWLGKGLSFLLDVFGEVAKNVPDAVLYIAGYTRKKTFYGDAYMKWLRAKQYLLGIGSRTFGTGGYVPDEMVDTIYSAADLVALPYRQDYSSVSGVVHQAAGYGKVMVCSRSAKFTEVEENISPDLVCDTKDKRAWVDTMTRLLNDTDLADTMRQKVRAFARRTSWKEVGRMHLKLYEGLLEGKSPADIQQEKFPLESL